MIVMDIIELRDRIKTALEQFEHPASVAVKRWEVTVGEDWIGEPAVFATAVLEESRTRAIWHMIHDFEREAELIVRGIAPDRWPVVRVTADDLAFDPDPPVRRRH
jgi:hypothetical protein